MSNLILGTASFLSGYGVSNNPQKKTNHEIEKILRGAQELGINRFDTAPAYGEAEEFLGRFLDKSADLQISTKLGAADTKSEKLIRSSIGKSLMKLQMDTIETLYLHDESNLLHEDGEQLFSILQKLLSEGLVKEIGVSIYTYEKLAANYISFPELSAFQVPENICDRRLLTNKLINEIADQNKSVTVRSVFLQGLLLMESYEIPDNLIECKPSVESLERLAELWGVSRADLCLSYAKNLGWCSGILVGADNLMQLKKIVDSNFILPENWQDFVSPVPEELADPRNWHHG
jgi:aryl-alcohol dehydrogenase-like predicted oxidoreductase